MPNVYPNNGSFTPAKEIFVKDAGVWKTVKEVWVNDAGTWKKAFPESTGSQSYTSAGTYSWTVPNGVYSISVPLIVGGGGGGASQYPPRPDTHGGGGGGSGGYTSGTVSVTPGETLTIIVGSGGYGSDGNYAPASGTVSTIRRGGTNLIYANGGGAGGMAPAGDNGSGVGGTGGYTNGVNGGLPRPQQRNDFDYALGGNNGTGYGTGGIGNSGFPNYNVQAGAGTNGYVGISW